MDIKQKIEYNETQKYLMNVFKFNKENIELKGSSTFRNIKFYSDYDFFSAIRLNYGEKEIYEEFKKILNSILSNVNMYFIEFKIQDTNGNKKRFNPNDYFMYKDFLLAFKDIDFCKIDIVYYDSNKFIEASCIYSFNNKDINIEQKELKQNYLDDIKELKKEGNYYKVLKRLYNIYGLEANETKIEHLTNFFNGENGVIYRDISNIDAIKLVEKYYGDDPLTKKRIENNLYNINYTDKNLYNSNKKIMNKNAKKFYDILI